MQCPQKNNDGLLDHQIKKQKRNSIKFEGFQLQQTSVFTFPISAPTLTQPAYKKNFRNCLTPESICTNYTFIQNLCTYKRNDTYNTFPPIRLSGQAWNLLLWSGMLKINIVCSSMWHNNDLINKKIWKRVTIHTECVSWMELNKYLILT